jgi:hypothetical protein
VRPAHARLKACSNLTGNSDAIDTHRKIAEAEIIPAIVLD